MEERFFFMLRKHFFLNKSVSRYKKPNINNNNPKTLAIFNTIDKLNIS